MKNVSTIDNDNLTFDTDSLLSDNSDFKSDIRRASQQLAITNSLINLSIQNMKFNDLMSHPSSSTYSFEKYIHEVNMSSSVFKLTEAIRLNVFDSLPYKGKKPLWDTVTPEIEKLSKSNLDCLLSKLSSEVVESKSTIDLTHMIRVFSQAKSIRSILTKSFLAFKKVNLSLCDTAYVLRDLNSDPINKKTSSVRLKLARCVKLNEPIIKINGSDLNTIIDFYSLSMIRLYNVILTNLIYVQCENLINNNFNLIQYRLFVNKTPINSSPTQKRSIKQIENVPIEQNPKSHKRFHAI